MIKPGDSVKIRGAATVGQDFRFYSWPYDYIDIVFKVEECTSKDEQRFRLRAPGYGDKPYGCGCVYAYGRDLAKIGGKMEKQKVEVEWFGEEVIEPPKCPSPDGQYGIPGTGPLNIGFGTMECRCGNKHVLRPGSRSGCRKCGLQVSMPTDRSVLIEFKSECPTCNGTGRV